MSYRCTTRHEVIGLQAATDAVVIEAARADNRVLISADTDFGALLAQSGATAPSFILIRRATRRRATEQAMIILNNLGAARADLEAGAVVVITDTLLRIRKLPIRPVPEHPEGQPG